MHVFLSCVEWGLSTAAEPVAEASETKTSEELTGVPMRWSHPASADVLATSDSEYEDSADIGAQFGVWQCFNDAFADECKRPITIQDWCAVRKCTQQSTA